MGTVTITHVIGTATLIGVFLTVSMFYGMTYGALQTETLALQLQQVTDYVSSNQIDLVSLCCISSSDQFLIKTLEMPKYVGTYTYTVTLLERNNSITGEKQIFVQAFFDSKPYIYREAALLLVKIDKWNGTTIEKPANLQPKLVISSVKPNLVVWVLKQGENMIVGIGNINLT